MSMYPFRGGPWDGFVIEYGDRVEPGRSLQPGAAGPPEAGLYWMNTPATAYVWAPSPPAELRVPA